MGALDNPRHEKFAQLVAKGGISDYQAYVQALGTNEGTADKNAWRLRGDEGITARITEIQGHAASKVVLSLARKRQLLHDAVEKNDGELTEKSPLAIVRKIIHPDGSQTTQIEGVNPVKALELDAKLAGELNSGGAPTVRISMYAQASEVQVEAIECGPVIDV
jgi:hypothetical protein